MLTVTLTTVRGTAVPVIMIANLGKKWQKTDIFQITETQSVLPIFLKKLLLRVELP